MSVVIFIIILSVLVIIHELGHYLVAKKQGIKVEEFGLGYPPRAWKIFQDKSGTEYTLNWLPFGGFVRLFGEEDDNRQEGAFTSKPAWRRLLVVLAGAGVNLGFGVIGYAALYTYVGWQTGQLPWPKGYVEVKAVAPESPAQRAGLKAGDRVVSLSAGKQTYSIKSSDWFIYRVGRLAGEKVTLKRAEGEPVTVYVRKKEEVPSGQGALGVEISDADMNHYPGWELPGRGVVIGTKKALDFGALLMANISDMVLDGVTRGKVPEGVSGPIGIGYQVEKQGILNQGFLVMLDFAAMLSINLAIINVLPIPALDGGRAVFVLGEMLTGRRVKAEWERAVNTVGFSLLLGLILLISIRDVGMVFGDTGFRDWWSGLLGRLVK